MAQFPYRNAERTTLVCMERNIFKDIKAVVADNEPAFQSNKLRIWAKQRVVELCFPAPYHLEANSLAERVIRDLETFTSLYLQFKGGWKCLLEAGVARHNRSYTVAIGCSPHFAAFGTRTWLAADKKPNIFWKVSL